MLFHYRMDAFRCWAGSFCSQYIHGTKSKNNTIVCIDPTQTCSQCDATGCLYGETRAGQLIAWIFELVATNTKGHDDVKANQLWVVWMGKLGEVKG